MNDLLSIFGFLGFGLVYWFVAARIAMATVLGKADDPSAE